MSSLPKADALEFNELFEVDEQEFAGSQFILEIIRALQQAYSEEKLAQGLTQQSVADKLGLANRSIVNRWLNGTENLTARSIGELAWALNRKARFVLDHAANTNVVSSISMSRKNGTQAPASVNLPSSTANESYFRRITRSQGQVNIPVLSGV